jgi:hypothetical protein
MAGGGAIMTKPLPPDWRRVRLGEVLEQLKARVTRAPRPL